MGYQHGQEVTRSRVPPLRMPLRDKFKLKCAASALLQPFLEVWLHPAPLPAWGGDQPMPRALPGPTGENPKAPLRTMPRRDPHFYFLTSQAHSAAPRRGAQGFSAPRNVEHLGQARLSSRRRNAGICKTAPAAPASLLQTDLWPVPVPAARPLTPPVPRDDTPTQRAQASANARGWSNVSAAAGPDCGSGTPVLVPALVALITSPTWRLRLQRAGRGSGCSDLPVSPVPCLPQGGFTAASLPGMRPASSPCILPSLAGEQNRLPGRILPQAHGTHTPLN